MAPHSGHTDAGVIYHAIVRLSLEPDRHFLGHTGLWRFAEKAVSAACWKVRFQYFKQSFSTHSRWSIFQKAGYQRLP
jgi:hypothetical protein